MHLLQDVPMEGLFSFENSSGEVLKVRLEGGEEYRDDLTGQLLDPVLVREARAKEMEYVRSKGLWVKRPRRVL